MYAFQLRPYQTSGVASRNHLAVPFVYLADVCRDCICPPARMSLLVPWSTETAAARYEILTSIDLSLPSNLSFLLRLQSSLGQPFSSLIRGNFWRIGGFGQQSPDVLQLLGWRIGCGKRNGIAQNIPFLKLPHVPSLH